MGKPFFRRLFSRPQEPAAETTETPAEQARRRRSAIQTRAELRLRGSGAGLRAGGSLVSEGRGPKPFAGAVQPGGDVCRRPGRAARRGPIKGMDAAVGGPGRRRSAIQSGHKAPSRQPRRAAGRCAGVEDSGVQVASALGGAGLPGSDAAWAFVALAMTREDVAEGGRRVAAFVPTGCYQPEGRDALTLELGPQPLHAPVAA